MLFALGGIFYAFPVLFLCEDPQKVRKCMVDGGSSKHMQFRNNDLKNRREN